MAVFTSSRYSSLENMRASVSKPESSTREPNRMVQLGDWRVCLSKQVQRRCRCGELGIPIQVEIIYRGACGASTSLRDSLGRNLTGFERSESWLASRELAEPSISVIAAPWSWSVERTGDF